MRRLRDTLWFGACVLAGCGGGSPSEASAPAGTSNASSGAPPSSAELGPVCPGCVRAGGESSDFDGGSQVPPCGQLIHSVLLSEEEAIRADLHVALYRDLLERPFELPLRWTDLSASSASPRDVVITGFQVDTSVRGRVTLSSSWWKVTFDDSTCDRGYCPFAGEIVDCRLYPLLSFYNFLDVTLVTDDAALNTVLHGSLTITGRGEAPLEPPGASALSVYASADLADVTGGLRIAPPPQAPLGTLALQLSYFPDRVRGELDVSFTNGWRDFPGGPLDPIDEQLLVAKFPVED